MNNFCLTEILSLRVQKSIFWVAIIPVYGSSANLKKKEEKSASGKFDT